MKGIEQGSAQAEGLISPERQRHAIVACFDMEGPLIRQDTLREAYSQYIPIPKTAQNAFTTDYGGMLYDDIVNWHTTINTPHYDLEIGSGVAITSTLLTAVAYARQTDLIRLAQNSQRVLGADQLLEKLRLEGAYVIGATSAWQDAHAFVKDEFGLHELHGTPFNIDMERAGWQSGAREDEAVLLRKFIQEYCMFIASGQRSELQNLFERFFFGDMGIELDALKREKRGIAKTEFASRCEQKTSQVVGHRGKANRLQYAAVNHGTKDVFTVAIGDGSNDQKMLENAEFSIALNAPVAVDFAKLGYIGEDVSSIAELIVLRFANRGMKLDDFILLAQEKIPNIRQGEVMLHKAGSDIDPGYKILHAQKRRAILGAGANIA